MSDHRRFIRHPAHIPIEFSSDDGVLAGEPAQARDVSLGGLAFEAENCPQSGSVVEIHIPTVNPPFHTRGRVVWCHSRDSMYEVGVQFLEHTDAFRTRMVEQVCHIEDYRRRVREEEGRELSTDEAAREWIGRFAGEFPR